MKDFKSISSSRPRMSISILVFSMTMIIYMNGIVANDDASYKEIIDDLPAATDFEHYLSALEKAVDFCVRHKNYVDLNLQFGLFMIDVNLRQTLQQRRTSISAKTRSRLENLFVKVDELANYFHFMVQTNRNKTEMRQSIKLTLLFYNTTSWPRPLDKFNTNLLKQSHIFSPEQLKKIYGEWENYFDNVNDLEKEKPTPAESDACISFLVEPPLHLNRRSLPNCLTPPRCKKLLQGGSEFGYGLTHRLLYLIIAHFSRRCVVFSERGDKIMTDMYCKKCSLESEYIASNSFQLPDLMYEHIALCSLFGHVQFIRNYWIKTLLRFQTSEGCFSEKIVTGDFDENEMREDENVEWKIEMPLAIMNGQCNLHFTAVATATFANALRYIIETYY